jgi:hypothetical protein
MKTCFKCNLVKDFTEFYKHPRMSDGYLGKCKACAKKDIADNCARKMLDPEWQIKERERQRIKEARRRGLGLVKKYAKIQESKEKRKAKYGEYMGAIKAKKLIPQPCAVCGNHKVQGHHEDYAKPLDVVWLCIPHHQARHIYLRNAKTRGQQPLPIQQYIQLESTKMQTQI